MECIPLCGAQRLLSIRELVGGLAHLQPSLFPTPGTMFQDEHRMDFYNEHHNNDHLIELRVNHRDVLEYHDEQLYDMCDRVTQWYDRLVFLHGVHG